MTAALDPPETVEEEMDKDTWDTAKDSAEFSREEEVGTAEPAAPAAEEALDREETSVSVLAWVEGVGL